MKKNKNGQFICPSECITSPRVQTILDHITNKHRYRSTSSKNRLRTFGLTEAEKYEQEILRKRKEIERRPLITETEALKRGSYCSKNPVVYFTKSTIPGAGYGVFAAVDLLQGDIVTFYSGVSSRNQPIDGEYYIQLHDDSFTHLQILGDIVK